MVTSDATHPVAVIVTVNVYVPAELTMGVSVVPPETMVPPFEADHAYVAPDAVLVPTRVIVEGEQAIVLSGPALTSGSGFTFTILEEVATQPAALVTVTVNVVATASAGVTIDCVVAPVLQTYEPPPNACNVAVPPAQTETVAGAIEAAGSGATLTVL